MTEKCLSGIAQCLLFCVAFRDDGKAGESHHKPSLFSGMKLDWVRENLRHTASIPLNKLRNIVCTDPSRLSPFEGGKAL